MGIPGFELNDVCAKFYTLGPEIGRGAYGKVFLGTRGSDRFAIKRFADRRDAAEDQHMASVSLIIKTSVVSSHIGISTPLNRELLNIGKLTVR
jgi:hypothetical protein